MFGKNAAEKLLTELKVFQFNLDRKQANHLKNIIETTGLKMIIRFAFLNLIIISNAYAYVDPGSGMLLWQGFVALIGAILIFFRNPIQVIKSWINWIRRK